MAEGDSMNVMDQASGENWHLYHADAMDVLRGLPSNSIHYGLWSPAFESLYTFSDDIRDLSNCQDRETFWKHYRFICGEITRVMMPGRLVSIHCMDLPLSKLRDGEIGLRDFPGELLRAHQDAGMIYHSRVCIRKDPVVAAQRTKALGLLHKQMVKDSAMSRMGIADYVITMRKSGENPEPVAGHLDDHLLAEKIPDRFIAWDGSQQTHTEVTKSIQVWQRYAEPVWMDIVQGDTLSRKLAREEADEAHISPLQLGVIRRCIDLWTNPGDVVLSPFAGIGSEVYCAVEMGRRGLGVELKGSYYVQAVANMRTLGSVAQDDVFGAQASVAAPAPARVRAARWSDPTHAPDVGRELRDLALRADKTGAPVTLTADQAHEAARLLAGVDVEREIREAVADAETELREAEDKVERLDKELNSVNDECDVLKRDRDELRTRLAELGETV